MPMKTCQFCHGTGRNAVIYTAQCSACHGLGETFVVDGPEPIRDPPTGGGAGCLYVVLLAALLFGLTSYYYSATVFFKAWTGSFYPTWPHFFIYTLVALALIILVARLFGLWAGLAIVLLVLLPVIHSCLADTGFYWVVFREEVSKDTNGNVRFFSLLIAAASSGYIAYSAASSRENRCSPIVVWETSRGAGRVGLALLGGVIGIVAIANLIAISSF